MSSTPEEDAAWKAIVQHYGDEPVAPEPEPEVAPGPLLPAELSVDESAHFVPPPPPPMPVPQGPRGLAWLGVLGVPLVVILLAVLPWDAPGWVLFFLLLWFAGGFVYLVATMKGRAEDGWDDGAVV